MAKKGVEQFRLVLEVNNLTTVSSEDRYYAAVVVVEGVLGELLRLERIENIDVVPMLEADETTAARPIAELATDTRL
jgi:hypothetical protein